MTRKLLWLAAATPLLLLMPSRTLHLSAQSANCGPFTDVPGGSIFCGSVLQSFISGISNGTSATTFDPSSLVPREQAVAFFTRTMDQTLRRGSQRTAIGKTWAPVSSNGGVSVDVCGGSVMDVVSDGTFLWVACFDNRIRKVNPADRRVLETWTMDTSPIKICYYGGKLLIANLAGKVYFFDPSGTPGAATPLLQLTSTGYPSMAFDGTNVWVGGSTGSTTIARYPLSSPSATISSAGANVFGMVYDGNFMWVLLADRRLQKMTPAGAVVETVTLPNSVTDCRMAYDGNNIWIPSGNGTLQVVRPTTTALPSAVLTTEAIPNVGFPYVASFDGENVMIGGVNNGTVAMYKATSLTRTTTFNTGAAGIRGIASDGFSFYLGDSSGTKLFQF